MGTQSFDSQHAHSFLLAPGLCNLGMRPWSMQHDATGGHHRCVGQPRCSSLL